MKKPMTTIYLQQKTNMRMHNMMLALLLGMLEV